MTMLNGKSAECKCNIENNPDRESPLKESEVRENISASHTAAGSDRTYLSQKEIMAALLEVMAAGYGRMVSRRIVVLILLLAEVPVSRIMELTGAKPASTYVWRCLLKKVHSVEQVKTFFCFRYNGCKRKKGRLVPFIDQIKAILDKENFYSRQQIADMIHEKFNIIVSLSWISVLLKTNEYRKLKCGSFPIKADVRQQREFYDGTLKPLMDRAKAGEIRLYFADAAHFVMGCDFIGSIWSRTRRFQQTLSGRKRYNVLGAIDFVSKKVLTVTNGKDTKNEYITATEVMQLLKNIASAAGKTPVYMILDNARYQKCTAVQETAKELGIHLVYIPPYSPNLNLIERFWKFTKSALRTRYFTNYEEFCRRIDEIIASSTGENKEKIDSLIGEKVQLFDELSEVADHTYTKEGSSTEAA